jgi:hypothetical protein
MFLCITHRHTHLVLETHLHSFSNLLVDSTPKTYDWTSECYDWTCENDD